MRYARLPARDVAVSTGIIKRFKTAPLTLMPEWLTDLQETSAPGGVSYVVRTDRLLLGLKAHTNYREAWFNLGGEAKYSGFRFRVDGEETPDSRQRFVSVNLAPRFDLFDLKLFVDPHVRYVRFFNTGPRDNVIFDAKLRVPGGRLSYEIEAGNLLGVGSFIQRTLMPALLSLQERAVFVRFVRAGVMYKF